MNLELLKENLYSESWNVSKDAATKLAKCDNIEARIILFESLASDSVSARNSAALAILNAKMQEAVPHLVKAIMEPRNVNHRGTLVYALGELDCSKLFSFLFRLALEGNFECRSNALNILWEQGFWVSDQEISEAEGFLSYWKATQQLREDDELLFSDLELVLKDLKE